MLDERGASAGGLLALIECHGPLTRAELVSRSGLPRTTVTGLVADLIGRGQVTETGADQDHTTDGERTAGRPPRALAQRPDRPSGTLAQRPGRPPRTLTLSGPPTLVGVLSCSRSGIEAALVTYAGQIVARASHHAGVR